MALRINVGSGQRPFKGWINVDTQARWNPDVQCDFGSPGAAHLFKDNSAEYIVLHHVAEHYNCGEIDPVLRECHRILQPCGSVIITVPNMLELAGMWMEGRLTDQLYFTNVYGAYMGDIADIHKWGYTSSSLGRQMSKAGFSNPEHFDWRPIEGAEIARDRWILGMEAWK